jgi:hypothetical protein
MGLSQGSGKVTELTEQALFILGKKTEVEL